jgi:hypothetical protein
MGIEDFYDYLLRSYLVNEFVLRGRTYRPAPKWAWSWGAVPLRGLDLSLSSSHAGNNYRNPLYPPDRLAQLWRRTPGPSKVLKIECMLASFFKRFKKAATYEDDNFLGRDSMQVEGTADPYSTSLRAGSALRSPGFTVQLSGFGKLHAPFLTERGTCSLV